MKYSLTIHADTFDELLKLKALLADAPAERAKPKAKNEMKDEAEEENVEFEGFEDEAEEETIDEAPAKKRGRPASHTVEDVIEAMQKYAEENDRKAAIGILKKYKVKSVHDLDKSQYAKILKDLEV